MQHGLTLYQQAQNIALALAKKSPDDLSSLYDLAFVDNKVGETLKQLGQSSDAMDQFNNALEIARKMAANPAATIEQQAYLPSTLVKIAGILVKTDLQTALADYAEAISLQKALVAKAPRNDIVLGNLLLSYRANGDALLKDALTKQGDFQPAFDQFEAAIAVGKGLLNNDAGNALWLIYLASAYHHYGDSLISANRLSDALAQFKNEIAIRQTLVSKDPTNSAWQKALQQIEQKVTDLQAKKDQGPPPPPAQGPSNQNPLSEAKP